MRPSPRTAHLVNRLRAAPRPKLGFPPLNRVLPNLAPLTLTHNSHLTSPSPGWPILHRRSHINIARTYSASPTQLSDMTVDTSARLGALRAQLWTAGVDGFLIPSEDAHASEYIQDADKRREFISGFSGSAGTALVTQESAWLWTDGRYHQQAGDQLGQGWTLMKQGLPGMRTKRESMVFWLLIADERELVVDSDVKSWQDFLPTMAPLKIGLDPKLILISDYNALLPSLPKGTTLVPTSTNLIDDIWTDQPARPTNTIVLHPLEHAGQSTKAKLDQIRTKCRQDNKWGIVVSLLDEVSLFANVRQRPRANPLTMSGRGRWRGCSTCAGAISTTIPSSSPTWSCPPPSRTSRPCSSTLTLRIFRKRCTTTSTRRTS